MKKVLVIALAFSLVLGMASVIFAVSSTIPGVQDTPHDVRVMTGEGGATAEPCAMCHTPHSGTGEYPLWNRDQGAQAYTMYASPSFDMVQGTGAQPQSPSSLCLVCHNGVYSSLVNYPGPGSHQNENYDFEMNPTFWAILATDLTDDHPLSFTYEPSLDADLNGFPTAIACLLNPTRRCIAPPVALGTDGYIGYPLYGSGKDQFECATCHSVHDTVLYSGKELIGGKSAGAQVFFLRHTNEGSQMCGACHQNRLGNIPHGIGAGYE